MSREAADDLLEMRRLVQCQFFLMAHTIQQKPMTERQSRTGWREIRHGDHRHRIAVGWRLAKEREDADKRREAEMAVCPYVECTCGHHED